MDYDNFKEGCSVIKEYADNLNKETAGKIPTKVSELTNDSNYATESYVNTAIGNIAQPSSLPQTYKKKAVTLATSGWVQGDEIDWSSGKYYNEDVEGKRRWYVEYNAQSEDTVYFLTSSGEWREFYLSPNSSSTSDTLKIGTTPTPSSSSTVGIEWSPTNEEGKRLYFYKRDATFTYIFTSIRVTRKDEILYRYPITDADVKVNSEVRLVLDEANGKLAGQFGLKKTIDKEAGKLTFTADTLPTSAISGTLEIGETSTEGAAFVEGIIEPSSVPATVEQTADVIKFPPFLINGTKVQRVYITGREIIQPGGSKQATVNLATYGIDDAKIMMTDGKMNECILASAETLSTVTTYFPTVRADAADVSGNRTLFFNIDAEPPAEEACIINYQYICLLKVEV